MRICTFHILQTLSGQFTLIATAGDDGSFEMLIQGLFTMPWNENGLASETQFEVFLDLRLWILA